MRRRAFAHDAVLMMGPEADPRAPGGAITTALCGHWQHQPPCPLAEHYTHAERTDGEVHLHVLFATAPDREGEVRELIDAALAAGAFAGPDGTASFWSLVSSAPGTITPEERDHAARLAG